MESDISNENSNSNNAQLVRILLYIPNIIGYFRLLLLLVAHFQWDDTNMFLLAYTFSVGLDFFDGIAARYFRQTSSFGAWLDVIIDNVSRSLLWANLFRWGWIVISIEWMTFVGNHYSGGANWRELNGKRNILKSSEIKQRSSPPPWFMEKVMENGFKTPMGFLTISGLHVLPIWIYGMQFGFLDVYIFSILILILLIIGRLLCLACELWCIFIHVERLLMEDIKQE